MGKALVETAKQGWPGSQVWAQALQRLTRSASVLVSFKDAVVNPFTLGLDGCSLSESTITSGEGGLFSDLMSLSDRGNRG